MKQRIIVYFNLVFFAVIINFGNASAQIKSYSVEEAVAYAIKHQIHIVNAKIDQASADARMNEVKASGLPQVHISAGYAYAPAIQRVFLPAQTLNINATEGEEMATKFGVKHTSNAMVTLNQIIFDGAYFTGLKAAQTYKELSYKNLQATKIDIAEAVTKAYYNVLINEARIDILKANIFRIDSMHFETDQMNKQGFVEKLDVDRLEVQRNNLHAELENTVKLQEIASLLLKYQMNFPVEQTVVLTDKLSNIRTRVLSPQNEEMLHSYDNRVEYAKLGVQEKLQELDVRNISAGYLPTLSLRANYGYALGSDIFKNMYSMPWFNQSTINVNLTIPIWDSFSKKNRIIQSKNELEKIKLQQKLLQQTINLEINQSQIQVSNLIRQLKDRIRNLELANEIVRVTRIKYTEAVGSNIEVILAESAFKEAHAKYLTTLYELLIAKVDLNKAKGTLYTETE